jgi:hypothetical protein
MDAYFTGIRLHLPSHDRQKLPTIPSIVPRLFSTSLSAIRVTVGFPINSPRVGILVATYV